MCLGFGFGGDWLLTSAWDRRWVYGDQHTQLGHPLEVQATVSKPERLGELSPTFQQLDLTVVYKHNVGLPEVAAFEYVSFL